MIIFLFYFVIIGLTTLLSILVPLPLWFMPLWLLISIIAALLLVILSIIIGIPFSKIGKVDGKIKHFYIRHLSDFTRMILRMRITKVIGKENIPNSNFVIYANHKSNTDPFTLVSSIRRPMGFAAKSGVFTIPIIKHWLRSFGCININRDNDREAIKEILVGIKNVEAGLSMAIFPEGGIKSRETTLMEEVKPGAYRLATKPQVPILPVAIIGARHIQKNAPFKCSKLQVIILPMIEPSVYNEMTTVELGDHVKELINQTIITYTKGNL
ncbi:MAG: lysophospholipid acyltransferase family protein [Acholeplasmataceae bacterium]